MTIIPQFLKSQPVPDMRQTGDFPPLGLDSGFEEACRKEMQELTRPPMQTDEERTIEAMENLVTLYTDKGKTIDGEIAALEKQLVDKRTEKQATARLCAWATNSLAGLKCDPIEDASPSPKPDKPKKTRAAEVKAG